MFLGVLRLRVVGAGCGAGYPVPVPFPLSGAGNRIPFNGAGQKNQRIQDIRGGGTDG